MQDWKNAWQAADDLLKIKSSLKDYAVVKDEDEVISRTNPEILDVYKRQVGRFRYGICD